VSESIKLLIMVIIKDKQTCQEWHNLRYIATLALDSRVCVQIILNLIESINNKNNNNNEYKLLEPYVSLNQRITC
jgi:putative aminopeptidase FrvX